MMNLPTERILPLMNFIENFKGKGYIQRNLKDGGGDGEDGKKDQGGGDHFGSRAKWNVLFCKAALDPTYSEDKTKWLCGIIKP